VALRGPPGRGTLPAGGCGPCPAGCGPCPAGRAGGGGGRLPSPAGLGAEGRLGLGEKCAAVWAQGTLRNPSLGPAFLLAFPGVLAPAAAPAGASPPSSAGRSQFPHGRSSTQWGLGLPADSTVAGVGKLSSANRRCKYL